MLREIETTWHREESQFRDRRLKPNCARAASRLSRTRLGLRAAETHPSLVDLYASDLLFTFMWSLSKTLRVCIGGNVEAEKTRHKTSRFALQEMNRLRNTAVADLINAFKAASCWSEHETCLGVVSPLSIMHKLPIPQQWFKTISKIIKNALRSRNPVCIKEEWRYAFRWAVHRIEAGENRSTTARVLAWLLEQFHHFQYEEQRAYDIPSLERTATGKVRKSLRRLIREGAVKHTPMGGANESALLGGVSEPTRTFLNCMQSLYVLQGREVKLQFKEITPKPKLPTWFDFTPLHKEAVKGSLGGECDVDRQRIYINVQDVCGWTPLHYAASNGNYTMVESLFEMDADPELTDFRGYTTAHHACLSGSLPSLKIVIDKSNMAAQAMNGLSPIHLAAWKGYSHIVRFILSHALVPMGIRPSTLKDFDGRTAAHWAAAGGHRQVLELLGVGMDVRERHGLTLLHMAVLDGHTYLIGALYRLSAEGEVKDESGRGPLVLAYSVKR